MSKILGKWLDSSAKQAALEAKLVPARSAVLAKASGTGSSVVVTTEVAAVAAVDTARSDLTTGKGIYAGAVSGQNDSKKVIIRAAGTDEGIDDGEGNEIYGVLSEDTGVFTLSFKQADGGAYTFASDTSIDFYFVEIFDLYSLNSSALLNQSISGVIDASVASSLGGHLDGSASRHDANEIDYERADGSKINIQAASDDVEAALSDLDDAIGALAASPTNYTPSDAGIVADHLAAIDTVLGGVGAVDFADNVFRISDNTTSSKKIAFEASGIAESTVRTITMPDRNVDLTKVTERKAEVLTLDGTDITNKYKDLTVSASVINPSDSLMCPIGGIPQAYTDDYTIITDGSYIRRVNWDGLALDGVLEAGDKLRVIFEING